LGLIETNFSNYKKAIEFYSMVQDKNMPYLNNSLGFCLMKIYRYHEAETFFEKEIELGKNVEGAVTNLAELYTECKQYEKLNELLSNNKLKYLVPIYVQRLFYLEHHQYIDYLKMLISRIIRHATLDGIIAGLFMLAIWFTYFVLIDIFEREQFRCLLLTAMLGMFSAFVCTILYDMFEYVLNFRMSGIWYNDLAYCIFGIGLIEEGVKIMPVLIIYRFKNLINESVDFIIYASISALGFAFMENLIYFNPHGIHTIAGRAFSAVIIHMVLSSIAIYGLFLSNRKRWKYPLWLTFGGFFALACILHGLYDFALLGKGFMEMLAPGSFFLLLYLITVFGKMINNTLNASSFYSDEDTPKLNNLGKFLAFSLSYILLLQYLAVAIRYDVENANINILKSLLQSYALIFIIVHALTRFKLNKNKLLPVFK